jgi:recombinational DNA repair protein RecR
MQNSSYVTKSITVLGADGNTVTVSETAERQEVVMAIQQSAEGVRPHRYIEDALREIRQRVEQETSIGVFSGVAAR